MHEAAVSDRDGRGPKAGSRGWAWAAALLLATHLLVLTGRGYTGQTLALVASSLIMFAASWISACGLLGWRRALRWVLAAVAIGWSAEQTGATLGWFFGSYHYTAALGPRLGAVPIVIPLMWFALVYTGYALANLMLWRTPGDAQAPSAGLRWVGLLMAALLVTAYDLGADPLFVRVLKAWVMVKSDGGWFGETLQGFVGWTVVASMILIAWRVLDRGTTVETPANYAPHLAAIPLAIYGLSMASQIAIGQPVETRVVALFAMGLPWLAAGVGWWQWRSLQRVA